MPAGGPILLDVGGVLVLPDPTVLGPLLAVYDGDTSVASHRRAHYAAMAAKSRVGSLEGEWSDYDRAYVEAVGVSTPDIDEAVVVLAATRSPYLWRWPIPESVAALGDLHRRGRLIGVVSNAAGQVEAMLRRVGICHVGDGDAVPVRCVIDSHVVGIAKPDPRIFDHALVHFEGVDRSEITYVGDSVTMDVGGARAAGLRPVLFDPYDDHPDEDVERIASLADLV